MRNLILSQYLQVVVLLLFKSSYGMNTSTVEIKLRQTVTEIQNMHVVVKVLYTFISFQSCLHRMLPNTKSKGESEGGKG